MDHLFGSYFDGFMVNKHIISGPAFLLTRDLSEIMCYFFTLFQSEQKHPDHD